MTYTQKTNRFFDNQYKTLNSVVFKPVDFMVNYFRDNPEVLNRFREKAASIHCQDECKDKHPIIILGAVCAIGYLISKVVTAATLVIGAILLLAVVTALAHCLSLLVSSALDGVLPSKGSAGMLFLR